jgi:predicted phosphodiesterase
MRLAVISDIHSNLHALEAVAADLERLSPDEVVVAGDFINRGPQPREVVAYLRGRDWPLLRGNHEDYVLSQARAQQAPGPTEAAIMRPSRWTAEQVSDSLAWIAGLPEQIELRAPDGGRVLIVHASPRHNRDGIYTFTSDEELALMLGASPPPLLVCGHTHQPLTRVLGETLVVNVGSVGLPFNGNWMAQYGLLEWGAAGWQATLRSIPYDHAAALRAYDASGFLRDGGALARIVLEEALTALPHLGPWYEMFADQVRAGALDIEESILRYLAIPSEQIARF